MSVQPTQYAAAANLASGTRPDGRAPSSRVRAVSPIHPMVDTRCQRCGEPARVHVLNGYVDTRPVVDHLCVICAATASPVEAPVRELRGRHLASSALLIFVGCVLALVGLASDTLLPDSHAGFGWAQRSGLALGALLVVLGTLLRIEVLALVGVFVFGGALIKDWVTFTHSPGFGWKHKVVLIAAALCLVYGLSIRLRMRLARRQPRASRAGYEGAGDHVGRHG